MPTFLKGSHEVSKLLRSWKMEKNDTDNVPWTREDRLWKSANDLVETERDYVKVSMPFMNRDS